MKARNFEDETHGMNTENVQQDGREEIQVHLLDDGRNFEDKTL